MVNYYDILEIQPSATEREIKSAFRKLAKKYHPDVNHSAEAPGLFKKIYMAYEVLSDPYKKRLYDELREESLQEAADDSTSHSGFDYDTGFNEWERRASTKAEYYANMRYEQFRDKELKGFDFVSHQLALLLGVIGLFTIGGGTLFFAETIVVAVIKDQVPAASLIGAVVLTAFGLFMIWQVIKMTRVFRDGFIAKIRRARGKTD